MSLIPCFFATSLFRNSDLVASSISVGCLVTTERVVQADGAGVVGPVVGVGVGVVAGVGVGVVVGVVVGVGVVWVVVGGVVAVGVVVVGVVTVGVVCVGGSGSVAK
jgi:hypothetical protein